MGLTVQYIIAGLVLIGAAVYIVMKLVALRRKGKIDSCCGCSLSEACNKNKIKNECHEDNKDLER